MAHFAVHIPVDVGILSFGAAMLDGISARDYNVSIQAKAEGSKVNVRRMTYICVVELVLSFTEELAFVNIPEAALFVVTVVLVLYLLHKKH